MPSTMFIAETTGHAPFGLSEPAADVIAVTTDDPDQFERGTKHRFEIDIVERNQNRFDGRLLRSQPTEVEPTWLIPHRAARLGGPTPPKPEDQ